MLAIKTKKYVKAVIEAPPSKSYTQRALVIAALANGKSIIKNPLFSDDTSHMISALKAFGARTERKGNNLVVYGTNGKLKQPKGRIFSGNAGTTMRFITAFASLADGTSVITGDKRMQQRPINDLLDALRQLGVKSESSSGCPPVKIYGGNFIGGTARLKGSISSQYLSSILMVAPYAEKDIKNVNYKKFIIKNTKKYKSGNYVVEGDASSASYFFAAAAVTKGKIMVKNINPKSKQGDIKFVDILKRMGCGVRKGNSFIEVQGGSLKGIHVDMNEMPDIVPTLAVTSLFADSATTIRNVPNLRLKETDRLRALAFELRKIGANVEEMQDGLNIKRRRLQKAIIETYNDHRMAMSFAVAGLVINGVRIKNPGCVAKSFPDFWKKFNEMYKK